VIYLMTLDLHHKHLQTLNVATGMVNVTTHAMEKGYSPINACYYHS